jgi:hypothetical protein
VEKRWYENNKDRLRAVRKRYYEANREHLEEKSRQWRQNNYERNLEKYRLQRQNNPEALREKARRWRENNPSYTRRGRKATPKCLTKDQKQQITEIHRERQRLTRETGIVHHVDHIVQINGRTVRGLNVPWNVRTMKGAENVRRPRIWKDEGNAADFSAEVWKGYRIIYKGNG